MNKNKNYNDEDKDEDEDVSIMLQAIYLGLTAGGVLTDGEPAPPHPCSIITQVEAFALVAKPSKERTSTIQRHFKIT